jgi:MYXO-CTERM domain-containing protein
MNHRWALLFILAGCVPPTVEEAEQEIIGGINSDDSQNSVVRLTLRSDGGIYMCSGTLIAPNLVLTARHCVSMTAEANVGCNQAGVGDSGGQVFGDYAADELIVTLGLTRPSRMRNDMGMMMPFDLGVRPHGMKLYHDDGTNLCNHDLALILLDQSFPNAPISPIRLDGPPTVGETFTAVGWGVTDKSPNPSTRQQRQDIAIQAVGPASTFGGVPKNEFAVGEGPCSGDSGGPALDSQTNAIIGTVSRGGNGLPQDPNNPSANCIGGTNIYTQVIGFSDIIMQAFSEAGATPWLEGQPKPNASGFGSACLLAADCQSLLCRGAGDAAGVCTNDCSNAPCPTGFDCIPDYTLDTNVCAPHAAKSHGCSAGDNGGDGGAPAGAALLLLFALFALALRLRTAR